MSKATEAAESEVASASYLESVGTTISDRYSAVYNILSNRR
jgi:hypothetical protein